MSQTEDAPGLPLPSFMARTPGPAQLRPCTEPCPVLLACAMALGAPALAGEGCRTVLGLTKPAALAESALGPNCHWQNLNALLGRLCPLHLTGTQKKKFI